jgi:DNA-binding SARP family transcriptional activator
LTFELHRKIASYFTAHEYWEGAIHHLLLAGDYRQVNQVLENIGEQMIQKGRYESIGYWVSTFPETIRKNYPYLFFLMGEVDRYTSKFDAALENYRTAERQYRETNNAWGISISLRGQARVYLDTIRPLNADRLLQESLKYLNPAETPVDVADLLTLTAENQLNLGYPERAEELLNQSTQLNTFDNENNLILARLYLRTGRLKEGIELLETREAAHPVTSSIARPQRFHREASLLLSLFYAIRGEIRQAYQFAQRGIWIGEQLQSTFVQSVGYMRLGHALQLQNSNPWTMKGYEKAIEYYRESIEKVDVSRIHVEPLWGMCRALGYTGQIQKAEELALESLAIAQKSGDEWIIVLIRISLGAGEVLAGNFEKANHYLTLAESSATLIKDPFVLTVAQLWLAINAWQNNVFDQAFKYLQAFLPRLHELHYEFLVKNETFLGLKDREMVMPLLLAARENNIEVELINTILGDLQRIDLQYHPGFTLWVRTLDAFNVWRGNQLIQPGEWKREKAKNLFQLLVGNRGKWLHRDQIINILWPDTPLETATNSLKVAFNALNQVLEPDRPRGKEPYFVERQQELYRLNPNAIINVDTDIFEQSINEGTEISLRTAIDLYNSRYFEDSYVQEWLMVDEQYYHQQYLLAADQLIQIYIRDEKFDEALYITYRILAIDHLWEPAYRLQMEIFYHMGRIAMVHSVYKQCKRVLESELNMPVSTQFTKIYEELIQKAIE